MNPIWCLISFLSPFWTSRKSKTAVSPPPTRLVPQGHVKQLPPHRLAAGQGLASQQEWPGLPVQIASSLDAARLPDFQKLWGWAGFCTFSFSFSSVLAPLCRQAVGSIRLAQGSPEIQSPDGNPQAPPSGRSEPHNEWTLHLLCCWWVPRWTWQ